MPKICMKKHLPKKLCLYTLFPHATINAISSTGKEAINLLAIYLAMLETDEERSKLTEIYEKHRRECLYVAMNITHSRELAEEVVHQVFLKTIEKRDIILTLPRDKTRSRIVNITRNTAINLIKRESRRIPTPVEDLPEQYLEDEFDLTQMIIDDEARAFLRQCIHRLPKNYQVVLQLRYTHELSYNHIAAFLNEPQGTIAMRLQRAKAALRELLLKDGDYNVK